MSRIDNYKNQIPPDSAPPKKPDPDHVSALNRKEAPGEGVSRLPNLADNPGNFLLAMLKLFPFIGLFEYIADRCCTGRSLPSKVTKLRIAHVGWFRACIAADYIVLVIVTGVTLCGAAYALYKILVK